MINVKSSVIREQKKFWNGCLFHPTDAVEDSWGKRILDRISDDGSIDTVRVYAMLEDIVYLGEEGELKYDFRVSDLRISYLLEKGFDLVIAYGGMPDCIAESTDNKMAISKNKTRYKGKMWNSNPPKDYSVWEEVCYQYTKHNIEKFGLDVVSRWYLHCFNEPDFNHFFLKEISMDEVDYRVEIYTKMYEGFIKGVLRASNGLKVGGPALAGRKDFLRGFLKTVKEKNLRIDYISIHNYGTSPFLLLDGTRPFNPENIIEHHKVYLDVIKDEGFTDKEIVLDEWGMASHGFWNVEECPPFLARENEVYSAYYTRLIRRFIDVDPNITKLMICLSGQHEMIVDFSGFRNFFTLNHFAKPIYNAHLMASKLGKYLIDVDGQTENLAVIPTTNENGDYSVMLTYSSKNFEEDIPSYQETLTFDKNLAGKKLVIYCIDKETTNPYRLAEKLNAVDNPTDEQKKMLREEGKMKPIVEKEYDGKPIKIELTPNSTYLVQII